MLTKCVVLMVHVSFTHFYKFLLFTIFNVTNCIYFSIHAYANNRDYRSISEFFTRQLRPGVRTISNKSCMVSPVDGRVLHFGLADGHQIEQVNFTIYIQKVNVVHAS